MQRILGNLCDLEPLSDSIGLTIGNFDGVHLGHQFLIRQLQDRSMEFGARVAVLSFSPHPGRLFTPDSFQELMTLEDRLRALQERQVDFAVVQSFDDSFSKVPADQFLAEYMSFFSNLRIVLVGYDFRFGSHGQGDIQTIRDFFAGSQVVVDQVRPHTIGPEVVSSSLIRSKLRAGDVEAASRLLGREYELSGVVERGQALGRKLGFPTANLGAVATLIPASGVYMFTTRLRGATLQGVVNIGNRPTVQGKETTVEAHILDFSEDLYGEMLTLKLVARIRGEQKFANLDRLKEQIHKDIEFAKKNF